jgi:hypothetical protein
MQRTQITLDVGNVYNYKNSYSHCPQIKNMSFFITFYKAPMQNINNNNNLQANLSTAVGLEAVSYTHLTLPTN